MIHVQESNATLCLECLDDQYRYVGDSRSSSSSSSSSSSKSRARIASFPISVFLPFGRRGVVMERNGKKDGRDRIATMSKVIALHKLSSRSRAPPHVNREMVRYTIMTDAACATADGGKVATETTCRKHFTFC
jgi:hypothetical protein